MARKKKAKTIRSTIAQGLRVSAVTDPGSAAGQVASAPVPAAPAAVPEAAPAAGESHEFELEEGVPTDLEAYLGTIERDAILAALARTGHNRTAAAQLLGISFRQMRYRMRRLGLK